MYERWVPLCWSMYGGGFCTGALHPNVSDGHTHVKKHYLLVSMGCRRQHIEHSNMVFDIVAIYYFRKPQSQRVCMEPNTHSSTF